MKEYTLITGASSGIGLECARYLAEKGENLIVLARRSDRLEKLRDDLEAKHKIEVIPCVCDLSDPENTRKAYNDIREKGMVIKTLINNAGFGEYGPFSQSSDHQNLAMISVNISSLILLSKLFIEDAIPRGRGYLLNLASILSFFPYPNMAVYAATKSFVLSFSESLRAELDHTGIVVSALCPGPTETEFASEEMLQSNSYQGIQQMSAAVVARKGIDALYKGKDISVPGFMNKLIVQSPRFTPRSIMRRITKHLGSRGN